MDDFEAFKTCFQEDRWVYDKSKLSMVLGHKSGVSVIGKKETGNFVVRPIFNFDGGGRYAYKIIGKQKGVEIPIPLNFFWQKEFVGMHTTVDYFRDLDGEWKAKNFFQGYPDRNQFTRFFFWQRCPKENAPRLHKELRGVASNEINVEMIDGKIIEAHLRHNSDPVEYSWFIPIWEDDPRLDTFKDGKVVHSDFFSGIIPHTTQKVFIKDKVDHEGRVGFVVDYNEYLMINNKDEY
ncbi:hypothetical protein [Synechococcus phage BUCT-ZZ01]|nr:hypothetical protein [Synechococcus phage BUCT-ZZ01]